MINKNNTCKVGEVETFLAKSFNLGVRLFCNINM